MDLTTREKSSPLNNFRLGDGFKFRQQFAVMLANARRLPFKPVKGQLKFFHPHF